MKQKKIDVFFSIIIPTYNSENTLELCLQAIHNQDFSQEQYEILIVDGGSTDATLEIAKKHNATILQNPEKLPEYAKAIGIQNAQGKYIIFHDSDEVITNRQSFSIKKEIVEQNPHIQCIISTGLENPQWYSPFGEYTNFIGDSFSAFVYDWKPEDYIQRYKKIYKTEKETENYIIFRKEHNQIFPIIDGGWHTFLHQDYSTISVANISAHNIQQTGVFAVTKNDPIKHYSSSSLSQILRKIKFRVINNVFWDKNAGYVNRENAIPQKYKMRKFMFMFYGFSLLFPLIKWIIWSIKRHNAVFLFEPIIALYTALSIIYYMLLKVLWHKTHNQSYW